MARQGAAPEAPVAPSPVSSFAPELPGPHENWGPPRAEPTADTSRPAQVVRLDDYFEQLDAAFETLDSAPVEQPKSPAAAVPITDIIDWFGRTPSAPESRPDLPISSRAPVQPAEAEPPPLGWARPEPVAPPPEPELPPVIEPQPAMTLQPPVIQPPPEMEAPPDMEPPPAMELPPATEPPPAMTLPPLVIPPPPPMEPTPLMTLPPPVIQPPPEMEPPPATELPPLMQPPSAMLRPPAMLPPSAMLDELATMHCQRCRRAGRRCSAVATEPPLATLPPIADAFAAILAVEQHEPMPAFAPAWPTAPASSNGGGSPSEDAIEEITRRVLDRLSDRRRARHGRRPRLRDGRTTRPGRDRADQSLDQIVGELVSW